MATYRAHTYHDRWIVVARRYYTTLSFTFRRAISIVRDKLSYFRVSKNTELLQIILSMYFRSFTVLPTKHQELKKGYTLTVQVFR